MKKTAAIAMLGTLAAAAFANQQPTSNENPAYKASQVQAQLMLNIDDETKTVHFIRDTNDPKIVTKTYVLKHADPYSIRPYVREMVQSLRVDYNNPAGQLNPAYYNTYSKDNAAKTGKIFVPTGVECIRYEDGTGILMVAAEDYRFKDSTNGMGIDSLIASLDKPGIMNSSGQPKYIYFPANRSAKELQEMIKLVGANVSNDTVELIGGKDKFEVDGDLNCLFLNTALYSRQNIEDMLRLYDIPHPEVRVSCTVYELNFENDGMLGLDFQSWKNNDGVKFFSAGARYSRNYNIADMVGIVSPDGTINSHYFNFEPKWNTKFLDFLVSKSKAKVVSTGDLCIKNGAVGKLLRRNGTMYAAATKIPNAPESGNEIDVKPDNDKFKFELTITPSVTARASTLDLVISTVSMLGYTSSGAVRSDSYDSKQRVMLGTGKNRVYLGGIEKSESVSVSNGVPLLKDLPGIGWIFSTERESTKRTRLVVVAECEVIRPDSAISQADLQKIELIKTKTRDAGETNHYGYSQYLIDPAKN